MPRKSIVVQGSAGRAIRVTMGVKTPERIVDPTGFLTRSSRGLSAAENKEFQDMKRKIQSGEISIQYP